LNAQFEQIENTGLLPGCHPDSARKENSPSQTSFPGNKIKILNYSSLKEDLSKLNKDFQPKR
jgi:hypothetical protein